MGSEALQGAMFALDLGLAALLHDEGDPIAALEHAVPAGDEGVAAPGHAFDDAGLLRCPAIAGVSCRRNGPGTRAAACR